MAASPADLDIAQGFGGAVVQSRDLPGPASYDSAGRRYVFVAPDVRWRYALDVERADTRLDAAMMALLRGLATAPPLQSWTVIEVAAKLLDQPVHLLLRQLAVERVRQGADLTQHFSAPAYGLQIKAMWAGGLWIALGRAGLDQSPS